MYTENKLLTDRFTFISDTQTFYGFIWKRKESLVFFPLHIKVVQHFVVV